MVSGVGRPWEKIEQRLTSLLIGRRKRVEDGLRVLPSDLAEQIIAAADRELERVEERRATVKESLARLEAAIADHREETKALTVTDERGAAVKTQEHAERSIELGRLSDWKRAHLAELTDLDRQQSEAAKVRRAAEAGRVHALLTITSGWRNPGPGLFHLEGLKNLVPAGPSDPAGNPLPPEALNERGEADLPSDPR